MLVCLLNVTRCLHGLVWSNNALIALEYFTFEQHGDPASQVSLHEVFVVLLYLGQDMPFAHLMELVLDTLHDLPHNEVLIHEQEEEPFEKSVQA